MNELDKSTRFYKMVQAEALIRKLAGAYTNGYMVGLFACTRELFVQEAMSDCYSVDGGSGQAADDSFLLDEGDQDGKHDSKGFKASAADATNYLMLHAVKPTDNAETLTSLFSDETIVR